MSTQPKHQLSYLLRLRPAREEGTIVWRASLEDAQGGPRLGFASLARLVAFLVDQTSGEGDGDGLQGSMNRLEDQA